MGQSKRNIYDRLKERDGAVCGICKGSLEAEWAQYELWRNWANIQNHQKPKAPFKRAKLDLSIDHIVPKSIAYGLGWEPTKTHGIGNLQLAHKECNVRKGNRYNEATCPDGNESPNTPPKTTSFAPTATGTIVSSEHASPTSEPEKAIASVAALSGNVKQDLACRLAVGRVALAHQTKVRPLPSQPMTKQEYLKLMESQYNAMAKYWNSLPGSKLKWPEDRFSIRACSCRKVGTILVVGQYEIKTCKTCGYPLKGEWTR